MGLNTGISWAHHSQNFWAGCDKVSPECAHCYIDRVLVKQGRKPWGELYKTQTWGEPLKWNREARSSRAIERVFTCSISDFFHVKADTWRPHAWQIIRECDHLIWLVLTKRPERIAKALPHDWGQGYPNVWLGVSAGCRRSLNKMDSLRRIPVHQNAVCWVSTEPLLEDISQDINLDGFGWVVTGGESGSGQEYLWNPDADWRAEFEVGGRRTMKLEWARNLRDVTKRAGLPFMFKQVTSPRSSHGVNALGRDWHEYPPPHLPYPWRPQPAIDPKHLFTSEQIAALEGRTNLKLLQR